MRFLKNLFYFVCLAIVLIVSSSFSNSALSQNEEGEKSWQIQITEKNEPGETMVVRGRVLASDGKTPLQGIRVHVYHTDAEGVYSKTGKGHRLKGDMITNDNGEYLYRTIRPASYPGQTVAAHVHYEVYGPNGFEQEFELLFEGDPLISSRARERAKERGGFFAIRKIEKDENGIWQSRYDLILKLKPPKDSGE